MAITFTDAAKDALKSNRPHYIRRLRLYKLPFDSAHSVSLEITDRVVSWGLFSCQSTAAREDWEKPNVTIVCKNINNELNKYHANAWWKQNPVVPLGDIMLWLYVGIDVAASTPDDLCSYYGHIEDAVLKFSDEESLVELVTCCWQNKGLQRTITKQSGGRLYQPANTVHTPPGVP